MLDARLFYGADAAVSFLTTLGAHGRTMYFIHECIDLVFITTYTLLLRALTERWEMRSGALAFLIFAPATSDLLETVGILVVLGIHPTAPRLLAGALGYFTLFKWISGIAVVVAMLGRKFARREPLPKR